MGRGNPGDGAVDRRYCPPVDHVLLARLERFYNAVAAAGADVEPMRAVTLFVRPGGRHPLYARPSGEPTVADLSAVRARQRELGVPEAFEWVHEALDERDSEFNPPVGDDLAEEQRAHRAGSIASALAPDGDAMASGLYQRAVHSPDAADIVEVVGVATLPAARKRGLGAAVTAALAHHALSNGASLVFLSAHGEDVARVYERVGFHRVGTACIAEPVAPVN